jgi:hypothetical protein
MLKDMAVTNVGLWRADAGQEVIPGADGRELTAKQQRLLVFDFRVILKTFVCLIALISIRLMRN